MTDLVKEARDLINELINDYTPVQAKALIAREKMEKLCDQINNDKKSVPSIIESFENIGISVQKSQVHSTIQELKRQVNVYREEKKNTTKAQKKANEAFQKRLEEKDEEIKSAKRYHDTLESQVAVQKTRINTLELELERLSLQENVDG